MSRGTGVFVCLFGPGTQEFGHLLLRCWDTGVCWWSALSTLDWRVSDFARAFDLEPAVQGWHRLSPRAGGSAKEPGDGVLQLDHHRGGLFGHAVGAVLVEQERGHPPERR